VFECGVQEQKGKMTTTSYNNNTSIILPFDYHCFSQNILHKKQNNDFFPQSNQDGIKSSSMVVHKNIEHLCF
jgi:hypothetical protein